jgi:hypothetical protein
MTGTEMGEYLVGAYLKMIEHCAYVDYNVHPPGGRLKGLGELDVVGFKFEPATAYVCEVVTHIRGLLYGNYSETLLRLRKKYQRQRQYAREYLKQFERHRFMLWSPVVASGLDESLAGIEGLEIITNRDYTDRIEQLREEAGKITHDVGNPAFRLLQILEHMKPPADSNPELFLSSRAKRAL